MREISFRNSYFTLFLIALVLMQIVDCQVFNIGRGNPNQIQASIRPLLSNKRVRDEVIRCAVIDIQCSGVGSIGSKIKRE